MTNLLLVIKLPFPFADLLGTIYQMSPLRPIEDSTHTGILAMRIVLKVTY